MDDKLTKAYARIYRLEVCLKYADLYAFCVKRLKEKKRGKALKRTTKSS